MHWYAVNQSANDSGHGSRLMRQPEPAPLDCGRGRPDGQAEQQQDGETGIAKARIERRRQRPRQRRIERADVVEPEACDDTAERIDDRRNPVVADAHQR